MPVFVLSERPVRVGAFDVVGAYRPDGDDFPHHAALADGRRERPAVRGEKVTVVHMRPPFREGDGMAADLLGTLDPTADEIADIRYFVDELRLEFAAAGDGIAGQYVVRPPVERPVIRPHAEGPDGVLRTRWRFSCVGFVLEAYRQAGVILAETDEAKLPPIGLATLKAAYPALAARLDDPVERGRYGLDGDGPWPVLLVGHVFRALDRSAAEIRRAPFAPRPGDEYFPARAGETTGKAGTGRPAT